MNIALIQGAPDNSGIGRRLLDTRFKYKQSNEQETQQKCSLNKPFYLKYFDKLLGKLIAQKQH